MTIASKPFRTSRDLVSKVLFKIGELSPGQAVAPESASQVNGSLDGIFRKLAALEIVYVSDAENIPAEWFDDLASIVAGELAVDFGGDVATLKSQGLGIKPGTGAAALSLKIMNRGRPTGEPTRSDFF